VILDVITIDVVVFQNDAPATECWIPDVGVNVFKLPMGIRSTNEMRVGQSEDVGQ
jgi:hypothetical protein